MISSGAFRGLLNVRITWIRPLMACDASKVEDPVSKLVSCEPGEGATVAQRVSNIC